MRIRSVTRKTAHSSLVVDLNENTHLKVTTYRIVVESDDFSSQS